MAATQEDDSSPILGRRTLGAAALQHPQFWQSLENTVVDRRGGVDVEGVPESGDWGVFDVAEGWRLKEVILHTLWHDGTQATQAALGAKINPICKIPLVIAANSPCDCGQGL